MEFDYRTGDCRELLKTVPDASVRLVVTSPPCLCRMDSGTNCISYYNASTAANAYGSGAADDEKTESYINHRLNCIFKDFLLIYKHQETERRL